jgi:DHA1 family tetracycline resistance protein-like MFS transporter
VVSPLVFGALYSVSVGDGAAVPVVGNSFFMAAAVLLVAAAIGRNASEAPALA